jgi:hypothetical protein
MSAAAKHGIVAGWIVLALAVNPGPGRAESDTDRPQFTETPLAVRQGDVQLELGTNAAAGRGEVTGFHAPEGLLRIGLVSRIELRLGYDHNWVYDNGDFQRDEARAALGAKFQLVARGEVWGLALIPVYAFDPDDFEDTGRFGLGAPWSYELSPTSEVAGGVGFERDSNTDESRGIFTILLARELHKDHAGFLEWAMDLPEGAKTTNVAHFGYTLDVSDRSQFDVHGGIGVGKDAPDAFLGLGFAILF